MARWLAFTILAAGILAACEQSEPPSDSAAKPPSQGQLVASSPALEPPSQGAGATQMWSENCSNCHGDRGQGGGAGTQTLLTMELFGQDKDRRFFDAIKNGVPDAGMDAYGRTMTDKQIWSLVVHIRELQNRALREQLQPRQQGDVYTTKHHSYRIETVVGDGLQTPWGLAWLPDGSMLVTNRPGPVYLIRPGSQPINVQGVPESVEMGQGGMMEVAVHPQYASNGWIYLAFSDPHPQQRASLTKVVRGKLAIQGNSARWTSQETIFQAAYDFYSQAGQHFGCRIVFDGKGNIFFAIGERGAGQRAQDLSRPNGKVYRLREDGSVPPDNPFVGKGLDAVWSYGHRNPQGLTMTPDGRLWDTEHGPRGGDELNLVEKGKNYGWPVVSFGINYSDAPFETPWPQPGQEIAMPVYRWLPSIAACGLDYARGNKFPNWNGDLLAGGLAGQIVDRVRVRNGQFVEREPIFRNHGRVRDVRVGPDGLVYVVLNQPDVIVRLVPAP